VPASTKVRRLAKLRPIAVLGGWAYMLYSVMQMPSLTFWAYYWLVWFFGLFLAPELYWVFKNPDNTVSDNTWRFESLNFQHPFDFASWTPVHWVFAVVYLLLMTWLFLHLVFGLLR
jgi:hypothetical protein